MRASGREGRWLVHRWLLVVPLVWQVALIPLVNELTWRPLGLPFLMVWEIVGIVVCTAVLQWVFVLDRRSGLEREEAAFLAATAPAGAAEIDGGLDR